MRALLYRLADGTVVNTLEKAKASGQKYEEFLKKVDLDKVSLQDYDKENNNAD